MKKIRLSFNAFFFITVVLLIMPGCKRDNNVAVDPLTGKIKTSKWTLVTDSFNSNSYARYVYDANGKLINIFAKRNDTAPEFLYAVIEYQTDMVIMRDSSSTDLTKYYLHPGTNLIDSTCYFYNGQDQRGYKVTRDAGNNIISINTTAELTILSNNIYIDTINYSSNNISHFHFAFVSAFSSPWLSDTYLNYDLSLPKRPTNEPLLSIDACLYFFNLQNKTVVYDLSILDIRLGNTYSNAVSSINQNNSYTMYYDYVDNSPGHLLINFTADSPFTLGISRLENTYYE